MRGRTGRLRWDDGRMVRYWRLVSLFFALALLAIAILSVLDFSEVADVPGAGAMRVTLWPLIFVTFIVWKWSREAATRQHARETRRRYGRMQD